jgi:hypothetical protein
MQFVVHLGPHKTGTTYLQESFVRLRSQLRERGTLYPDWWGILAHGELLQRLLEPPSPELEAQFAKLHADRAERVLISIEGLVGLPEKSIFYLRNLIGNSAASIVFYVRSWADVFPSTWREVIKEGSTRNLPEFLLTHLIDPWSDLTANFDTGLSLYLKHFGERALNLVSYDQVLSDGQDLFQHFAKSFLRWDDPPALPLGRINASHSATDTEIIRVLNSIETQSNGSTPSPRRARFLSENYLRLKADGAFPQLQRALENHISRIPIDERAEAMRALHRNLFSKYKKFLVHPHLEHEFFTPRRVEIPYIRSDYLLRPGVAEDLQQLYQVASTNAARHAVAGPATSSTDAERPPIVESAAATSPKPPRPRETILLNSDPAEVETHVAEPYVTVSFRRGGNSDEFLLSGWSAAESEFRWSAATVAELRLPSPLHAGDHLLTIELRPFILGDRLPAQTVRVDINGVTLGDARLRGPTEIRMRIPADVLARGTGAVRVTLHFPDAARPVALNPDSRDDRLIACALEQLALTSLFAAETAGHASDQTRDVKSAAPMTDVVEKFESLGENCEFGLVQRRCGIEPLGLLRFSSTPLPPLLKALRARFAGMGRPEFIDIEVAESGTEYMVFDKRFHFRYHAWVKLGEQAPEEIHARECRRLPLLVRKLIEDLTEGAKIFVYRGIEPLAEAQARELAEAIGGYGPGTLLWVERADAANPPGTVIRLGPKLLKGHIDRFAPPEDAHDLSLDCWITICRNALAMVGEAVAG